MQGCFNGGLELKEGLREGSEVHTKQCLARKRRRRRETCRFERERVNEARGWMNERGWEEPYKRGEYVLEKKRRKVRRLRESGKTWRGGMRTRRATESGD